MSTTNITLASGKTETLSSARLAVAADAFRAMWWVRFGTDAADIVEVDTANLQLRHFDDDARDEGSPVARVTGAAYVLLANAGDRGRDVWALCTVGESN